jgi:hypothetical protein
MALKMMVGIPVEFGETLLAVVAERRGERAIDDLFVTPPTTQEQLLDPWTLVADHQGYLDVQEPALEVGENRLHDGTFGAISWLVLLSAHVPVNQALEAAEGWGGDAYVAFEHQGLECVRVKFAGDTAQDLDQMKVALRDWVDAAPVDSASVRRAGKLLEFESCASEPAVDETAAGASRQAVSLAVAGSQLSVRLAKADLDLDLARCAVARLTRAVTAERLQVLDRKSERVRRALAACRIK